MKTYDAIVVGASAVGGITAKACAQKGLDTLLLEEHSKPGKFGHCTAICNKAGLDSLKVRYKDAVLNHVRGAVVHTPNASFDIDAKRTVAEVFDRQAFDETCVQEAINTGGAKLLTSAQLRGLSQTVARTTAKTSAGNFHSKYLVGTDGSASTTAALAGFPPIKLQDHAFTWQATFEKARLEHPGLVDVLLDAKLFPGFFAWLVPCGPDSCRVGLGTTKPEALQPGIRALLKHPAIAPTISRGRKTFSFHHPIPLETRKQTQNGRVLLAGDAAGQVKSTTGGGIIFGGLCGQTAAQAIADAIKNEELEYEELWRSTHGKPLKAHRALHSCFKLLPNALLDAAAGACSLFGVNRLLARFGDMDRIIAQR